MRRRTQRALKRLSRLVLVNAALLLLALVLTALLMLASTCSLYVTSSPKWISLLIEPLSLFLLPGMVLALAVAGGHDFAPDLVLAVSTAFYAGFFYAGLVWLRARRAQSADAGSR